MGRTTPLLLTEAGQAEAARLQAARLAAMERLLAPLPEPERRAFEQVLDRLLAEATTSRRFARTTCRLCDHDTCDGPRCPIGTRAGGIERAAAMRPERT